MSLSTCIETRDRVDGVTIRLVEANEASELETLASLDSAPAGAAGARRGGG